jgi:nickel-dependent lactate racemase
MTAGRKREMPGAIIMESQPGRLSHQQLQESVARALAPCDGPLQRVLLIHPDYSRNDFSHLLTPILYDALASRGLQRLDTLNAGGTHRPMTDAELRSKLGLDPKHHRLLGDMANHEYDDPRQLLHAGDIPADFVADKTGGHLRTVLPVTVNRMVAEDYDLIVCVSGTVPHEALGYSGGTKILFPGISGPEVIALLHWAAVLMGLPSIIGRLHNLARDVVNEGARHIFRLIGNRPVLSLNMVYTEDERHQAVPRGLFAGLGPEGFATALAEAARLSAQLHILYLDQPLHAVVQRIPPLYDEVWTAGKGSYKLQKPGVLAEGAEVILYAPHIKEFHSKKEMDAAIRHIGYHGRDWVVDFCRRQPSFNKNVAAHVINVRGVGRLVEGVEQFPFRITLASQLSERECAEVGLGYRAPESIRREDFGRPGQLWIEEGGQWLYARRGQE